MGTEHIPSRRPYPGKYLFAGELPSGHENPKAEVALAAHGYALPGQNANLPMALGRQQDIISPSNLLLVHVTNTHQSSSRIRPGQIIWALGGQHGNERLPGLPELAEQRDRLLADMAYLQMPHEFFRFNPERYSTWARYTTVGETGPRVIANALWFIRQIDNPEVAGTTLNAVRGALERRAARNVSDISPYYSTYIQSTVQNIDPASIVSDYRNDLKVFDFMIGLLSTPPNPQAQAKLEGERIIRALTGPSPYAECAEIYSELDADVQNTDMAGLHRVYTRASQA